MSYQNYVFFCSHEKTKYESNEDRAVFSQWRYSQFKDENNIVYNSGEQYMMYQKAILMKDYETAKKIIEIDIYDIKLSNESKVNYNKILGIKRLGREVKNFNPQLWDSHKFEIVKKGNLLKFSQNDDLKKILLETKDKILVEAASYDKIWGIGLSEDKALKIDPKNYPKYGENLLGKALMWTREQLRSKN